MSATATMARPAVPAGYVEERERDAIVVALPSVIGDVRAAIDRSGTLYDAAAAQPGAIAFAGRGAAYRMTVAGEEWLVRHYRRGGAVAHVLRDEYLRGAEPRPLRELHASVVARARGVATPEIMAAVIYPHSVFYRADLATRFVPHSRDLASVVLGSERADAPARSAAWSAAGTLLRTAFAAGVTHADLNLRNILIAHDAGTVRALLLDLDRAAVQDDPVDEAARNAMLERLHRSRRKLERSLGTTAEPAEIDAFTDALTRAGA